MSEFGESNGFNQFNEHGVGNANYGNYGNNGMNQLYAGNEIQSELKVKEKKKKSHVFARIGMCVLFAAMALSMGYLGARLATNSKQSEGNASVMHTAERVEATTIEQVKVDTSATLTPAEVYAKNVNSTVGITTSITTNYWGFQTNSASSGSGFIITDDGYIVTNYHVIEGANAITVTTYEGDSYDATLVGYAESDDIAVLKIDADNLTPVVIGDSENLAVGDTVMAIGNPLGELTFSLTTGVVSALDREVTLSRDLTMNLIQTDCAINSGNSGGALFNSHGEVVGITNAKYSGSGQYGAASIDNIGFAIPINDVIDRIMSAVEKGYIPQPYIGIQMEEVTMEYLRFGLPQGVIVTDILDGSPAQDSDLQKNDIIIAADGNDINDPQDLKDYISGKSVGDKITLEVYRNGEIIKVKITLGERD